MTKESMVVHLPGGAGFHSGSLICYEFSEGEDEDENELNINLAQDNQITLYGAEARAALLALLAL